MAIVSTKIITCRFKQFVKMLTTVLGRTLFFKVFYSLVGQSLKAKLCSRQLGTMRCVASRLLGSTFSGFVKFFSV